MKINFAEGCKLWSNDESGFDEAVAAAQASDVAIVMVGTWSLDQTLLWTPGTNATTGEHVDLSDLGLVGAQRDLVMQVVQTGKPTVVVFVSGKPLAEPWIQASEYRCSLVNLETVLSEHSLPQMPMPLCSSSTPENWAAWLSPRSSLEMLILQVFPSLASCGEHK